MSSIGLYTNRNTRSDFVLNAFEALANPPENVYIAVAFFTDPTRIEQLVARGANVRLVVRLGFPTSAEALERLMRHATHVELRYFTDHSFHPKIYLFGTRAALVGSANLTNSAFLTNQEVVVRIDADDPRLEELAVLFSEYWNEAKVLTPDVLKAYHEISEKYSNLWRDENRLETDLNERVGKVVGRNIGRERGKETQENLFLEDFRKSYQECVTAFRVIRKVYERIGQRKVPPKDIPLRLEIDAFISFVREEHAVGDSWMTTPLRSGSEQEKFIADLVLEWHNTPWEWLEKTVVQDNYPRLVRVLGSAQTIAAASDDELFDALTTVHSFYDRRRFFLGGLPAWRKAFHAANDPKRARDSLIYLLYGSGAIEERMANMIYNPRYKLNEFGRSNVQELVGWLNKEELPVINGRTTKVLRYLGFDVRQLS